MRTGRGYRSHAVPCDMTGRTGGWGRYPRMAHRKCGKGRRAGMTGATIGQCRQIMERIAFWRCRSRRVPPVMAGIASGHSGVIKTSARKRGETFMTLTAIAVGGRIGMRIGRGYRAHVVPRDMTDRTGGWGRYPRMVHRKGGKGRRAGMAGLAVLTGQIGVNEIIFRSHSSTAALMT